MTKQRPAVSKTVPVPDNVRGETSGCSLATGTQRVNITVESVLYKHPFLHPPLFCEPRDKGWTGKQERCQHRTNSTNNPTQPTRERPKLRVGSATETECKRCWNPFHLLLHLPPFSISFSPYVFSSHHPKLKVLSNMLSSQQLVLNKSQHEIRNKSS